MICDLVRTADGSVAETRNFAALPPLVSGVKGIQWYQRIDNPPDLTLNEVSGATLDANARTRTITYAARPAKQIIAAKQPAIDSATLKAKIDAHLDAGELREAIEALMTPLFKKGLL